MKDLVLLIKAAAYVLVGGITLLTFGTALARGAENPIKLSELSMDYISFFPGGYDPMITQNGLKDRALGKQLDLNLNFDIFKYLYWDNKIHSMTDKRLIGSDTADQFRLIGWNFRFGARPLSYLEIGYWHFSQHLLDTTYEHGHWPVQDGIQIKLYILKPKTREGLLD